MASAMAASIECPICFEAPSPPIYQCSNGHIVCSNCLRHINICGICREPLPGKPIRSLMAEQLAETIANLQISNPGGSNLRLTNYCNFLGLKDVLDCKERIPRDQIVAHMKQHGLNGVNGAKADVLQDLEDFTKPHSWFPVYFEAYDEIFFLLSSTKIDVSQNFGPLICWRCVTAGHALAAKQFCLQLCLTSSDKGLKNLFTCPIISIENRTNFEESQLLLPLLQLKQFGKRDGANKLEWTINVQIGKKTDSENGFQTIEDTNVPNVKTRCFANKLVTQHSSSPLAILRNSMSGNPKVFLDLTYDNELLGRLVIELRKDVVPFTAENFRCLCTGEKGFGYKGTCFYDIKAYQYMTGGDVTNDNGSGGNGIYGDSFKWESKSLKHDGRGVLLMDNRGNATNGSIFFIALQQVSQWDRNYVVFGKIIEGMSALDDLEKLLMFFNGGHAKDKKTVIQNCGQL